MKAQGVRFGQAPYGYAFSQISTRTGGVCWFRCPSNKEAVLQQIRDMRSDGLNLHQIARRLNEKGIAARRNGIWRAQSLSRFLRRKGPSKSASRGRMARRFPLRHDPEAATARALELRAQGLSLNQIGQRLRKEKRPARRDLARGAGGEVASEQATHGNTEGRDAASVGASRRGTSLREIGIRLAAEGILPKEGGLWHPAQVAKLLVGTSQRASAGE